MDLRLRPLRPADESVVRAAHAAFPADELEFLLDYTPETTWDDYLDQNRRMHDGEVTEDRVPASFLIAEVDGEIVGRSSIRFDLNDWLRAHGGHIGYGVLPGYRRRGYATEILRQSLIIARAHGVGRALLVCHVDNAGSAAVIESCGGRLDPEWPISDPLTESEPPRRRYWID